MHSESNFAFGKEQGEHKTPKHYDRGHNLSQSLSLLFSNIIKKKTHFNKSSAQYTKCQ